MAETTFAPGDMVMLNDPFRGGTHLPDITSWRRFSPVATSRFFSWPTGPPCRCRRHGRRSMPLSTSIFQEGLIIPR
jgi:N-methylhydantoinase B